ncbi:hypothetical protein GCM10009716_30750 [Streptomyces sodiiphilus]|uniref:23S rRNA (Guanosine(2251)-2'-O)-methyltransferase RlmB n=1 Tax=Streptomyces sodiiphilus TaxID=226217 RepID=A0ABN2PG62_9ACTN
MARNKNRSRSEPRNDSRGQQQGTAPAGERERHGSGPEVPGRKNKRRFGHN